MKNLILTKNETIKLNKNGCVEITRNGFDILVEKNNNSWEDLPYIITIINPYKSVKLAKTISTKFPKGVFEAYITYKDGQTSKEFVEYMGRQEGFECSICQKGNNAYTFNILHGKTKEDAVENYKIGDYETIGFGAEHLNHIKEV